MADHETQGQCGYCRGGVADCARLTMEDGGLHLLPDDPVVLAHPDAPNPMHKRCAMEWVETSRLTQVNVEFRLVANSVREGGLRVYCPPDTSVERVEDSQRDSYRLALTSESERGCVLVAAAFVDHLLAQLLVAHFPDKRVGEELVNGFDSPLGSFSARTKAAYALRLLTNAEYRQIQTLRGIRNDFAHDFIRVSFQDQSIRDRVLNLPAHPVGLSEAEDGIRRRFEDAVEILLANLRHRADKWSRESPADPALPSFLPTDDDGVVTLSDEIKLPVDFRDPWVLTLAAQKEE